MSAQRDGERVDLAAMLARTTPGHSLPREFYTDPDFFNLDVAKIHGANWIYAAHTAEIPRVGDFVLVHVGEEQIIVIRSAENEVRGFFNVCRHRGSQICTEDRGHVGRLVCPYHQWTFGLDGALLNARLMPADFDKSAHGLLPVAVAVVEGLIMIHLDPDAAPPADFAANVASRFGAYGLGRAKIAVTERWVVEANWKLVEENSRECYHCRVGHPQYVQVVGFAAGVDSEEDAAREKEMREALDAHVRAAGLVADPVPATPGGWHHMRRFPLQPGYVTESMSGERVVSKLLGDLPTENVGGIVLVALPNLLMEVSCDYAMILRVMPIDAQRTETQVQWLVHADAEEGRDYNLPELTEFWRLTSEQDWQLCEQNQRGVNSTRYRPGPYAPQERGVMNFVNWYLGKLAA